MPKQYCLTCKDKDTCKEPCKRVKNLLKRVTNTRNVIEELPADFKYQLSVNRYRWPSAPKKRRRKINGNVK